MRGSEVGIWESLQEYVARFKEEILSIAPPDESQKDLIWLFWKELPAVIKGLLEVAPYLDSVEAVLKESLEIASSLDIEEGGPEYTPSDWRLREKSKIRN